MKKLVALFVIIHVGFLLSSFTFQAKTYSLTVEVNQLRNSKGLVQFVLYNKDGTIPDEHYKKYYKLLKGKIENGSSTVTFNQLPAGKYAVNILHDENMDGKIDKGWVLPIEGIGFSNYTKIGIGNKPNFKKASFVLNDDKKMMINIIYL
jgi:uncharacterized protein (DUF2141 family)